MDFVPITLDSVYAEDDDGTDNSDVGPTPTKSGENIGRFCPIDELGAVTATSANDYAPQPIDTATGLPIVDQNTRRPVPNAKWRYHFAIDLFNYLDVWSPQDDYLPNVDMGDRMIGEPTPWFSKLNNATQPQPVLNSRPGPDTEANNGKEDSAGEEGKININTADWRVLATLPMVTDSNGNIVYDQNAALAQAIVKYRDIDDGSGGGQPHGPFQNLFELHNVVAFRHSIHGFGDAADLASFDPDDADGDFSPFNIYTGGAALEAQKRDFVPGGFESNFLALTRISNLITTRSDSFTAYVLVQGWRNVGTDNPELVVQRRAAFIADRTSVRPLPTNSPNQASTAHTGLTIINVPNN